MECTWIREFGPNHSRPCGLPGVCVMNPGDSTERVVCRGHRQTGVIRGWVTVRELVSQ